MEKLYPSPKTFVDDSEPDLDAAYFNGVETGLSAIDERIVNLLVSTLTSTVAGQKALDAVVGKILNDKITKNAEAISSISSDLALCEYKTITYTSLFDSHGLSYSVRINKIVYAHLAFVTNSTVPANADICQLINTGSMEAITNIAYKSAKGTTGTFKVDSARAQNLRTDGNLVSGEAFVIDIILRIK